MSAKYTPGPWSVPHFATDHTCDCHYVLSGSQHGMGAIATVHSQCEADETAVHNEPVDVARANAHLISAAPDLLEALEGMLADLPIPPTDCEYELVQAGCDPTEARKIAAAYAAIAKARGAA